MPSDEDLIIQIPEDEPLVLDDDTPVERIPPEQEQAYRDNSIPNGAPAVCSWPAIKMYHPLIGIEGTPAEIPAEHEYWMAANLMLAPAGSPLREGQSNIFISGKTPEDCAQHIYDTIVAVFKQMKERMSPIQKATMADVPPAR